MTARAAVVTGGSRGIGRAVVDRLLDDGMRVLTCGRSPRPDDLPDDAEWVQADVAQREQAEHVVEQALASFGEVYLLVNNAGVFVEGTVADSTDEDWDTVIGVNCGGVLNMCRAALPGMTQHGGVIVNIGSVSGTVADASLALYDASKGFVHALTRSIAVDHGPQVRCNAVLPGWIETDMFGDPFALASDPAVARRDTLARHPAGRMGQPADIAAAVAWLASDDASFVTGSSLVVDGGLTAASQIRPELF